MKRTVSIILTLIMIVSAISTLVLTVLADNALESSYASAESGDLLYKVRFGQSDGVYKSGYFRGSLPDPAPVTPVTVSDDGRVLGITHNIDSVLSYYGGYIDGLTIGDGKQYTITMKAKIPSGNSSLGIYFNFPDSFASSALDQRPEADALLGYYGTPNSKHTLAHGGYDKRDGMYICNGQDYVTKLTALFSPDGDGFYDIAFEVDGYSYTVYINNTLFDKSTFDASYKASRLGVSFMCYHAGSFEIKDVDVYKGLVKKSSATIPSYVNSKLINNHLLNAPTTSSSNKLLKTYAAAADKELLYKVKFNATKGVFTPATILDTGKYNGGSSVLSVTTTESSATFIRKGSYDKTNTIWGDTIDGLKISKDTTYTMTYKIKANSAVNMGIGFLTSTHTPVTSSYNIYGLWSDHSVYNSDKTPILGIQKGHVALEGEVKNSTNRSPFHPVADADGYTSLVVVVKGYKYNVYTWSTCDNNTPSNSADDYIGWVLFDSYDVSKSFPLCEELAFIAMTWNTGINLTVKDVCIYKGVAVDLSEKKLSTNTLAKPYDSAANGDLLYEVKFGKKDGVYQSAFFKASVSNPSSVTYPTVSSDGRTLILDHTATANTYYGGAIEGLTIGEGKQYTITMQVKIPTGDKSLGIYFNFPENFLSDYMNSRPEADALLGYYGVPNTKQTLAQGGSTKREGIYICNGQDYITKPSYLFSPDSSGFYNIAIEVDGYSYTVYINDTLFDKSYFDKSYKTPDLGISFMCYHTALHEIRNVNVYKGLIKKSSAKMPSYINSKLIDNHTLKPSASSDTNKLFKTYDEASSKDLLYKVKFNATEGVFTPAPIVDTGTYNGSYPVLSVSATEYSVTLVRSGYYNKTRTLWGDTIDGLKVNGSTTYTITYNIKANTAVNMGIGFLTNSHTPIGSTYNVYGLWSDHNSQTASVGQQMGYTAIKGKTSNTTSRISVRPVVDNDGYTDVAIVVEGYVYNVYMWVYSNNSIGWALIDSFDISRSFPLCEELAFMAVTWDTGVNVTVKDVCIYKGRVLPESNNVEVTTPTTPVTTTPPTPVTTPVTTPAATTPVTTPEITTPVTTPATKPVTTPVTAPVTTPEVTTPVTTPSQTEPLETTPVESAPIESAPVESTPVESTPVESTPVESTPVESTPAESSPVESTPAGTLPQDTLPESTPETQSPVTSASTTADNSGSNNDNIGLFVGLGIGIGIGVGIIAAAVIVGVILLKKKKVL